MSGLDRLATRRSLLLAGGGTLVVALTAAACSADEAAPSISPDQAALDAALTGENALAAAFEAGVVGSTTQQRRGQAAARSHRAHAKALIDAGARVTPAPTATPSPSDPRQLARRQRAQADRLERLALGVSPRVALLLGSIAASDAATAALLVQDR